MQTYKSPLKERIASSASLEQSFTSTCKISCKIRFTEAHEQKFIINQKSQVIFNTYMDCNNNPNDAKHFKVSPSLIPRSFASP